MVAAVRLLRRPSLYALGFLIPALDLLTQVVLIAFGFAVLFSPHALTQGTELGVAPTWHSLAFAVPLAMLAFTGLETVANLAEEARRPGVDLPRSLFLAIGTVVTTYVAIAVVALSAFPGPVTELGTRWLRAPLVGVAEQIRLQVPLGVGDTIRFFVGASGALILVASITTSISGFSRLAYSLGEHGQLPRAFGRLHRRTRVSPQSIFSVALISSAIVVATSFFKDDVAFLAGVFSFGVLLAFTATQVAVIRLRIAEPDLPRPYRTPLNVTFRGAEIPVPAVVGAVLTFTVWVVALVTHEAARYAGIAWLAVGLVVYVAVRRSHGEGLTERVSAPDEQRFDDVPRFRRILVPMKVGVIGEEMAATAVKLAAEHGAAVEALHVVLVSLDHGLDAPMAEAEARAQRSLEEAHALGEELGVERRRHDRPGARDRPRDRRPRARHGRRPDRARLVPALAPPVALLLADGRLRAAPRALRGADRGVPPAGARRGARGRLFLNAAAAGSARRGGRPAARVEPWAAFARGKQLRWLA